MSAKPKPPSGRAQRPMKTRAKGRASKAADRDADHLESLAARGLVGRPRETGPIPPELLEPGPGGPSAGVLDALLEERGQSRR